MIGVLGRELFRVGAITVACGVLCGCEFLECVAALSRPFVAFAAAAEGDPEGAAYVGAGCYGRDSTPAYDHVMNDPFRSPVTVGGR